MKFFPLLAVCLASTLSAAVQDRPRAWVRLFNDSPKAVDFSIDGRPGCSIQSNPEGNNAYCDAETTAGKHTIGVRGAKLPSQSCIIYAHQVLYGSLIGAEAHLSKGGHLRCFSEVIDSSS